MSAVDSGSRDWTWLIKGYAIAAVVLIHLIGDYIGRFSFVGPAWSGLVFLNQVSRFCVPVFVALSGYALARKYPVTRFNYFGFISSRAAKLLPWYLAWSAVYYLIGQVVPSLANFSRSAPLWELLIAGRTNYHLYFVPMIFQFYLLFPGFNAAVRRWPVPALLLSLLLQVWVYSGTGLSGWSDQQQYIWFSAWAFYFTLGVFLGSTATFPAFLRSQSVKAGLVLATLAGLILTVVDGFIRLSAGGDLLLATSFTRLPVILYAAGFFLLSFSFSAPKWLIRPGAWSYQIYLGHLLVLQLLSRIV